MAVLEAWAFRLPVVMSSECNLPEGFAAGAALEVRPEPGSISNGLRRLFEMSEDDLATMGQKGRELVERRFTWTQAAASFAQTYAWMLERGSPPAFIEGGAQRRTPVAGTPTHAA